MKFELSYIEDLRISDSKKLICRSSNGSMTVSFLERDMLFVEFDFDQLGTPQALEKASSILKGSPCPSQSVVTALSDENAITAASGNLQINISRINGNLEVRRNGITVFGGNLGNKDTVIPHTQVRTFRNSADQSWFARINEPLNEDDRFFGLGDKSGVPDRRGRRVRMFSRDSLGYDAKTSDPLYKSIPFFIKQNPVSGAICGFFYPEAQINAIDLGEESPFYSFVEIENGPIGFYIIPGDDYGQIMQSYCTVTGFPALPPLFSFGFFGSSMNYVESDDAMNRITHYFDQTEENKIPCEGMYVSSGYLKADDGKRYAFFWNKRKFPDYGTFLSRLHDRGYNLAMNIKPGFLTTHPWYEELKSKGYFLKDSNEKPIVEFYWGGQASFLDFSNPDAKEWWKSQLKDKYLSHGCTGIWNDNNECELEDPDNDSSRTKMLYPLLMCQAAFEACSEYDPGKRYWIYTRSACAGTQKYARTWTGDNTSTWRTLKYNQYQDLSLGLSGLPFMGNDLGGFFGDRPSAELLVRSCESAVFQPRFVIHSWREDDRPTEPWTYPEYLESIRSLIVEHYRFMPYIYTAAYEAAATGKPMNRILALEYPSDKNIPTDSTAFQCGPSVISVFPVESGKIEQAVYLPSGTKWFDPKKNSLICGGSWSIIDTPLGQSRYLFRSPSVIPESDDCASLTTGHFKSLHFVLTPGEQQCSYRYFEDDGSSVLSSLEYTLIDVTLNRSSVSFRLAQGEFKQEGRTVTARLPKGFAFENGKQEIKVEISKQETKLPFSGEYVLS